MMNPTKCRVCGDGMDGAQSNPNHHDDCLCQKVYPICYTVKHRLSFKGKEAMGVEVLKTEGENKGETRITFGGYKWTTDGISTKEQALQIIDFIQKHMGDLK